jgi:hypothetical protein
MRKHKKHLFQMRIERENKLMVLKQENSTLDPKCEQKHRAVDSSRKGYKEYLTI